jgi:hypothetical protein
VTIKAAVFGDVGPYGSCKNRSFEGSFASIIRVERIGELETLAVTRKGSSELPYIATTKVVPSLPIVNLQKYYFYASGTHFC